MTDGDTHKLTYPCLVKLESKPVFSEDRLTVGKTYTAVCAQHFKGLRSYLRVMDDQGKETGWHPYHFRLIVDKPNATQPSHYDEFYRQDPNAGQF